MGHSIRLKLGFGVVLGAWLAFGSAATALAEDYPKSSILRYQFESIASIKVVVEGREPHPSVQLLRRAVDTDEMRHYSRVLWLPGRNDVLTVSWNGYVTVWNSDTGQRRFRIQPVGDVRLSDAAVVKSGDEALIVGETGAILRINTLDGTVLGRWQDPNSDWVTSVTTSDDGALFATGNQQGDVTVWSRDEAAPLASWRAHVWPVRSLALLIRDSGRFLYSADPAGVKLWNVDNGELLRSIGDPTLPNVDPERWWFTALNFSEDRTYVVAGGYESARVIDLANGELLRTYGDLPMGVLSTTLNEGAGEVMVAVRDFTMRFYDIESTEVKRMAWVPFGLLSVVSDIVINPTGDRIVVAGNDLDLARWGSFPALSFYRYTP